MSRTTGYPAAPAQRRLHEQFGGTGSGDGLLLQLTGALDPVALREALALLADRHEALRTAIRSDERGPQAEVGERAGLVPLAVIELPGPVRGESGPVPGESGPVPGESGAEPGESGAVPGESGAEPGESGAERHDRVLRAIRELAGDGERDGEAPPWRAVLVVLGPQEHLLAVLTDARADHRSRRILAADLAAAYGWAADRAPTWNRPGSSPLAPEPAGPARPAWTAPAPGYGEHLAGQRARPDTDPGPAPAPILELLPDLRRPARGPYRSATTRHRLPAATLTAVTGAAQDLGVAPVAVLLAGLLAVLARQSGQPEVAVGCETPARGPGTAGLVGPVSALGGVRADLSGDPTFAELAVRAGHELARVDESACWSADPGAPRVGSPVLVQLHESPQPGAAGDVDREPFRFGPLRAEFADLEPDRIGVDLVIGVASDLPNGSVRIDYAADLFSRPRIDRLLAQLDTVLAAGTAEPDRRLSALAFLGAEEQAHLMALGRGPVRPVSALPLHELVVAQAGRTPDAIAGIQGEEQLTYRELERDSARLAAFLIESGVRPGDRVSLALDRGLLTLTATLAVLRAGAAYTPMDPAFPAARMEFLLADHGARVVLTTAAHAAAIPVLDGVLVVALDADQKLVDEAPAHPLPAVPATAPAFVIYTSGSTGTPKGVVLRHDLLTNFLDWITAECAIGPDSRVLHCCSPVFDVALGEIFSALTSGACVVVSSRDDLLDAGRLTALLNTGVTHTFCPPTSLAAVDPAQCPDVTCVILAGEMVPPEMVHRWQAVGARVLNAYGPAEAAVTATFFDCADGWSGPYVPIGRPQPNRELRVLDERRQLVPVGVPGEIVIAGFGVAEGYLNRPELTAERFVADPFGPTLAYRTGDLGRWNSDGALEILGRIDLQVKVNGIRIELGEVEAVLSQHPDVGGVAVVKREETGTARLVAYLVGRDGRRPGTTSLREHAATILPSYMVPAAYVVLDRFPLGGTGKIDRRALPAPDQHRPDVDASFQEPRTASERTVAGLVREVLGIDRVGALDSFFELGGTSLGAAALTARMGEVAGVTVPVSQVHRTHTIEALARWLEQAPRRGAASAGTPDPGALAAGPLDPVPATSSQLKAVWSHFENVCPLTWWIDGDLDIGALIAALGDLHRRHQALHSRYRRSEPPVVVPPADPGSPQLRLLADAPDEQAALDQLAEAVQQPLDYTQGKLWRAALLREASSGRTLFGIGVHHIAFDGWTQTILARELSQAYTARLDGRAPQWERPAPTLRQVEAEFVALREVADLETQRAYWREQLRDLPSQSRRTVPVPLEVAVAWGPQDGRIAILPEELLAPWDAAAREHGFRRSSYFIAAVASGLRAVIGIEDVAMLTTVAKRGSRLLDEAWTTRLDLGFLRLRPASAADVDLIAQADRTVRELLMTQDLGMMEITKVLGDELPSDVIATLPTFVFQDNVVAPLVLEDCVVTDVIEPFAREVASGLLIEVLPGYTPTLLRITFRTDQLPGSFAELLCTRIVEFLQAGPEAVLNRPVRD